MLLENLEDVGSAADIAERIKRELNVPFGVNGYEAPVTISIGIVLSDPGEIGDDHHEVFSSGTNHSLEHLEPEKDLSRAIRRGGCGSTTNNPQVMPNTGAAAGLEALLR